MICKNVANVPLSLGSDGPGDRLEGLFFLLCSTWCLEVFNLWSFGQKYTINQWQLTCLILKLYLAYLYVFHKVDIFDKIMLGKLKKPKPLSSLFTWIWTWSYALIFKKEYLKSSFTFESLNYSAFLMNDGEMLKKFVWKWYFVTKIVLTYCEKKDQRYSDPKACNG